MAHTRSGSSTGIHWAWMCVLACVACFIDPSTSVGQIGGAAYKDATGRFSVTPAPKWTKIGVGSYKLPKVGGDGSFNVGWVRSSYEALTIPYVLIEVVPIRLSEFSMADIEKSFRAPSRPDLDAVFSSRSLARVMGAINLDSPVLDRKNKRIWERRKEKLDNGMEYDVAIVGFFGNEAAVFLHFGCDNKLLGEYTPDFDKWLDSFAFDSGAAWVENVASKGTGWSANRGKAGAAGAQVAAKKAEKANRGTEEEKARGLGIAFGVMAVVILGIVIAVVVKLIRAQS